jgi:3-oxoacyl-[acyl-carrier-protein] synthase II
MDGLSRSILLTGLGTVGAYGCGAESLRQALAAADPQLHLSEVDRAADYHRAQGARRAFLTGSLFREGRLKEWLAPGEARRMSPPSKLAVASARMALRCAGFDDARCGSEATSVTVATTFGPSSYSEALIRQILFEGPESTSPFYFTESVANAPAAQIAILCRARGPSVTVCQREAGVLIALSQAAADVAAGKVPHALAGAVEEMTPLLHALLDRFGALARPGPDGSELARPFDQRRDGFLASEGAAMVFLETEESAVERGARPLARVLAWGSAFDPTAPPTGWGTGAERLARSLVRTLERAGLEIGDVDRIVSGASGSRDGDRLEAGLLRSAWGDRPLPPVLAPKATVGEYAGGFLGAAVLAAGGAPFGPTPGFAEPDPALGVVPHDGDPLSPPSTILVTSLAAGGAAAWLVLGAPPT